MSIGCTDYPDDTLPERGWKALREGAVIFTDHLQMDIEGLLAGGAFADTYVCDLLPNKYLPSYDLGFLRRFVVCVTVTGWKLFDTAHEHRLACLADELALHAIIQCAQGVLGVNDEEPVDFSPLEGVAFEDMDFETLFDPSLDGIEDTPSGKFLRMTNLKFREWFRPFNPERGDTVHPYVEPQAWQRDEQARGAPPSVDW